MKTKLMNAMMILSLHLLVLACSKTETSDMMFKEAVSEATSSAAPSPGDSLDPTQDPSIVIVNDEPKAPEAVVVVEPTPAPAPAPAPVVTPAPAPAPVVTPVQVPEAVKEPVAIVEPEVIYPESEVPVCKFDLTLGGLGSAAKVAVASAPKADLMNSVFKGFESLSNADLASFRNSIDTMKTTSSVLFLNESGLFDKQFFKDNQKIFVVIHSKPGKLIEIRGLGKDAQIYIMIVSQEHNTVCLRTDGNSDMGELALTAQTSSKHAARASVLVNGNGSVNSYIKVLGGHRSGSKYEGKSINDSSLTFITEGKVDTFTSVSGNGVSNSEFVIKIKGSDKTGYGMSANFINNSKMRMEIQGEDDVRAVMSVGKMENNDVSGWLKAKSGGKVDPMMEDYIELMPLP